MANLIILDSGHAEKVHGKQSPDKTLREWDFNDARGTETYVASNDSYNSKNAASYIQNEIYNAIKKID